MHYSLKQSLLAGASALVLSMGAAGAARAADADALATGSVHGNFAEDDGSVRSNRIDNANNNGAGIVHEQQNNGSNNALSAATASTGDLIGSAPATPDATAVSDTHDNFTVHTAHPTGPDRSNEIVDSFRGFDGIATVQQNNGDSNAIGAATANYGSAVALGAVGQTATADSNTENQHGQQQFSLLTDRETVRANLIDPSFNNSKGIATVQQNNGNANAIAAATSVVGAASAGAVTQDATAIANSENHFIFDPGATRSNEILNSFVSVNGVITVQQNNGDANALSAATAVYGSGGSAASLTQTALAEDNDLGDVNASAFGGSAAVNRSNLIDPSFNGAGGTVTVQQNNGSANQVAAATAVAGVGGDVSGNVTQNARANSNDVAASSTISVTDALFGQARENGIVDSFNNAAGVITVQQNNGDANTINAATAVAGVTGAIGGDLSQNAQSDDAGVADGGTAIASVLDATRSNTINPSFRNVTGTVTVQQNNGGANTMQASTAVAAAASVAGNVLQEDANAQFNRVSGPGNLEFGSDRDNAIADGSFNNAAGTVTVQQNNGDLNTINASTGVVAVAGAVGGDLSQDSDAEDNDVSFFGGADASSTWNNAVAGSFANAAGTITVQQNNGDANSVNAATLVASAGTVGGNVDQGDLDADGNDIENSDISDDGSERGNAITDSFNNVSGTTIVQQNNGNGNSLNAATAVLSVGSVQGVDGDVSQGTDVNENHVQRVTVTGSSDVFRDNTIDPSFTDADGIHTVQQNNGDANSMNVGVAVAHTTRVDGEVTQTVDAARGRVRRVEITDDGSIRHNRIADSFDRADGVLTVQQNNGNANVFQAGTAVLTTLFTVSGVDDISQEARAGGTVRNSDVADALSDRNNAIAGSFDGAKGILTVQQNNGDANVMAAATAVASIEGFLADFDDTVDQTVVARGRVFSSHGFDDDAPSGTVDISGDGGRYNAIGSSFTNGGGVATVQQNNGGSNVVAASTGVMTTTAENDSGDGAEEFVTQTAAARGEVGGGGQDFNVATHNSLGGHPPPYDRTNDLVGSFNRFRGVATVQQNNGDNNVLASATAVAANLGAGTADDLDTVDSRARTRGRVVGNADRDTASNRQNTIGGAFVNAAGVATVQQNNGSNNVVAAATTVAANLVTGNPHREVSGKAIGAAEVINNKTDASDLVDRANAVTGSFGGFKGIATVQQNNGGNNVMGASTAVAASDQGSSGFGPAVSLASLGATVTGNVSTVAATNGVDPGYGNLLSGSFNNAAGVVTVQQNNGSANAVQSAVSAAANFH